MAKEEAKKKKANKRIVAGGIFIPAGLFIGMGVGWALGYFVQGMFIGLGAGFLALGILTLTAKD